MADMDVNFGHFRFDPANQCLWRGERMIALTPKAYSVLRCLLQRPGQLVSKDELLDAAWPDASVSDASLKVCVREIRRALGDRVAAPRFIATVHRRGYRFIAAVDGQAGTRAAPSAAGTAAGGAADSALRRTSDGILIGRDGALSTLRAALARALEGQRQVVFVTGAAGIGKSALVDAFVASAAAEGGVAVACGRCLEHFGPGEPYLPLLEALGRLCRDGGTESIAVLRERAPTWLVQMPWLVAASEREELHREVFGGTQQRMLREITEALETLAARRPLLLVLEDLHWSDSSSLDALALLAQRSETARLLVVATYRPVDAILGGHPVKDLKQRLVLHRQCTEIAPHLFDADETAAYLRARVGSEPPPGVAEVAQQRTDGNPLFLVMVVDELLAGGALRVDERGCSLRDGLDAVAAAVPDGVRRMIELQIDRLAIPDMAVLEAAALTRGAFSAALVAAALDEEVAAVERRCERLAAQQRWIVPAGLVDLPDGETSGAYRFVYDLDRSVLAQRVPAARRVRLHQRIGEWLEHRSGSDAAPELAVHFERSGDAARAVANLRDAARKALGRWANREAIAALTRALALADDVPDAERAALRSELLEARGLVYRAMGEVAAAAEDIEAWLAAARSRGDGADEVRALWALSGVLSFRDRARCLELAEAAVERSRSAGDQILHRQARGLVAYFRTREHGWRPSDDGLSTDAVAALRERDRSGDLAAFLAMDAYFANLRGRYAEAIERGAEGEALAEQMRDYFAYAFCQQQQAWGQLHAGRWAELLRTLRAASRAAVRNQHRQWTTVFSLILACWELHAGLFDAAAARAADSLADARRARHQYGTALALMVSGWAELGRRNSAAARHHFEHMADPATAHAPAVEGILRLPLHLGLSACALSAGAFDRATAEAERACALAAPPREATYLALGHRAMAAAALAERRFDDAESALADAHAALQGATAPLAEWQVWSTAAALADARGQSDDAARCRAESAAVRDRLATALTAVDTATSGELGISIESAQAAVRGQQSY